MPLSNQIPSGLLSLIFNNTLELWMSLHVGPPGEDLENEVTYLGYARQRFAGATRTDFPQCVGGAVYFITWAALSVSAQGSSATLMVVELKPSIAVGGGVMPAVLIQNGFPAPPATPSLPIPSRMGSRFEALAAEMELEEASEAPPQPSLPRASVSLVPEPHAFVRGEFRRGERGGQVPEETCNVCGRDPRNTVHQQRDPLAGLVLFDR